jgi:hypothetical protein
MRARTGSSTAMPIRSRRPPLTAHDIAGEIIRRAATEDGRPRYVIRLSKPPTLTEQLQLMAARLERRPIVILPHKCKSVEEWVHQYASDR